MQPCLVEEIDEQQFIVEHSAHDGPSLQSQLVAHVEPMMEANEKISLGPTIDEEIADAQKTTREVIFADIGHQEALGPDKTILQVTSGPVEHGVSSLMKEAFLDIVVHPSSLGLPIDEVQVDAVETSKVAVFLGISPLQEYIDRACNIGCTLIGRETWIPRHIWLIGWETLYELSMVQHNGLIPYTGAQETNPSHEMNWWEIMSSYLVDGMIFSVESIV